MGQSLSSEPSIPDGCSHPLHVLRGAWPCIVLKSIEEQAAYADAVCIGNANDASFCEQQLELIRATFPHDPPNNTTGVGNLAYLALHATDAHRGEYKNIHMAYTALLLARRQTL